MESKEENSANESSALIESSNDHPVEEKFKWSSIWAHFITMFYNSIVTTVVYSSIWAYLKQMDPGTTTWYLGVVHAAFNSAELCFIVLFGIWVQYRGGFEPLVLSLIFFILGNALYAWAMTFGYYGKYVVLASRALIGCGTGNDVIVTALLAEQTSLKDRTKAMAYIAVAQTVGFTIGPAIQACFVPLGNTGVYVKGLFLWMNMYTAAGCLCVLFGIINLLIVIRARKQISRIPSKSDKEKNDDNDEREENNNVSKGDKWAVVAILGLFFITRHSLVFLEVMFAPLAMDEYALSNEDTVLAVGVILAIAGVVAAAVFIATEKFTQLYGDRLLLAVSILITFIGFAIHWPVSNRYPKLGHFYNTTVMTESGPVTKRLVTNGCAPTHPWCTTTPIITITQFAIGYTLITLSFPVSYCILPSLFTKVIQPGRQGILVSLFSIAGNLSRIFGPTVFTTLYYYYGPKGIFGVMDIGLFFAFILMLVFYKRMIPYQDYMQKKIGELMDSRDAMSGVPSQLLLAVENGDISGVIFSLENGEDIERRDANGQTALIVAAEKGSCRIIKELLDRNANVNARDEDGWTALIASCKEGFPDIVAMLLDSGAKHNIADMGGWTPLVWASYKGNCQVVKELLQYGADPNERGQHNMTALIWASGRGHTGVVRELLEGGARAEIADKYGTTALIWACRKGHLDVAKLLIVDGADINSVGTHGWTPLIMASKGGFVNVVDLILERHPNVNLVDQDGRSALTWASKGGHEATVRALLNHGVYLNMPDKHGDTPLILAAKEGHSAVVKALLSRYADLELTDSDGKTALYQAVERGHVESVRELLAAGARTDNTNKDGETPLIRGARKKHTQCIKLLLEKGADPSATDRKGDTALHIAVRSRYVGLCEVLLKDQKNSRLLYKPNKAGETPYSIDKSSKHSVLSAVYGNSK
eukprot:gene7196-8002_t